MNLKKILFGKIVLIVLITFISISHLAVEAQDDCISCHSIDIYAISEGIHGNLNNASTSDIYPACLSCHVDGSTRTCEYCHLKESENATFNNAPAITEHRSNAEDINTDAFCIVCHVNSVNSSPAFDNDNQRVAHYGTTTNLMTSVNRSIDCKWCHFTNKGNMSWGAPVDPRNSPFLYHDEFISGGTISNQECYGCHSNGSMPDNFHNASLNKKAGGKDCVYCHEIDALTGQLLGIDVSAMNTSKNIHYDLNSQAIATTTLDPNNVRCWACHGDGDGTAAAQPDAHPRSYRTPKNCSNNDCHAVNQSIFYEPMVYEHFKYADRIDENIEIQVDCEVCHRNSLQSTRDEKVKSDSALVSHYGSIRDLIKSSSCIYCHLDDNNAEKWGNAPDPTDNETTLSDTKRNAILHLGEKWYINNRFIFYFKDISRNGESAHIQILYNDNIINETIVERNELFTYTRNVIDKDGDEIESAILSINISFVFMSQEDSIIAIEGKILKRIHSESVDESCYACHMDNYIKETSRYLVLDKNKENTYYTELYADFAEDEINKELLAPSIGREMVISEGYNQTWTLKGFEFCVKEVDFSGRSVYINLKMNNVLVVDEVYGIGETIEYREDLTVDNHTMNDITIFRADVDEVFHGTEADAVVLRNVRIISNRPDLVRNDDKIGGYNASWLQIDNIFRIGGVPENLHVPSLNDGVDGGPDCVKCHDVSTKLGIPTIDAISTQLGTHANLNKNATSRNNLTDSINKACWACHGDGKEPAIHYETHPKNCDDCHRTGIFNAIELNDVPHGKGTVCQSCHGENHVIKSLTTVARIDSFNISNKNVVKGDLLNLSVEASSGWGMRIEAVEYFIDEVGNNGTGMKMLAEDKFFDSQKESAYATIDTINMTHGPHIIYVHSKERNRWGYFEEININIIDDKEMYFTNKNKLLLSFLLLITISSILFCLRR